MGKILFRYSFPLDRDRRELFKNKGKQYPEEKIVLDYLNHWRDVWEKANSSKNILFKLKELSGAELDYDLEVFVFGGGLTPMSTPLLMPVLKGSGEMRSDEEFLETFIHELAHRFTSGQEKKHKNYWDKIRKDYLEESILTQNHIIVYALLKLVLPLLFESNRVDELIRPKNPDYEKALKIVEDKGAQVLIDEFKNSIK